jgi:hypothetical protein
MMKLTVPRPDRNVVNTLYIAVHTDYFVPSWFHGRGGSYARAKLENYRAQLLEIAKDPQAAFIDIPFFEESLTHWAKNKYAHEVHSVNFQDMWRLLRQRTSILEEAKQRFGPRYLSWPPAGMPTWPVLGDDPLQVTLLKQRLNVTERIFRSGEVPILHPEVSNGWSRATEPKLFEHTYCFGFLSYACVMRQARECELKRLSARVYDCGSFLPLPDGTNEISI